jgi:integrase
MPALSQPCGSAGASTSGVIRWTSICGPSSRDMMSTAKIRYRRRMQTEESMRRKRYQRGSLQRVRQGCRYVWVVKYYDGKGRRRQTTLGQAARMTKTEAEAKRVHHMATINGDAAVEMSRRDPLTLGEFIVGTYLPFKRRRWKLSTAITTEDRIKRHIIKEIGDKPIKSLDRDAFQELLDRKSGQLVASVIDHLRFDLRSILELAVEDGLINRNPARSLFTARQARRITGRTMTRLEVLQGLSKLELRERLIWKLAVFGGLRPGEIFALQRKHVQPNAVKIEQRVYSGKLDSPKSRASSRTAAIPASLSSELHTWLSILPPAPDAWIFPSETGLTPARPENIWRRWIGPRLEKIGLGGVNFQVLRRTHASLGHAAGIDPKVRADQMGNGIGV